jgi:hypothetical protein
MGKCGKCGCSDVGGGSWAPDYCRRCGAIVSPSGWYYDSTMSYKFDPKQYDEEHKKVDDIYNEVLLEENKKMYDKIKSDLNKQEMLIKALKSPDFVEYEKDVISLVTLTRHTIRIKPNTMGKEVKRILSLVPDDTHLTLIDVDQGSGIAEFYFDVETIS